MYTIQQFSLFFSDEYLHYRYFVMFGRILVAFWQVSSPVYPVVVNALDMTNLNETTTTAVQSSDDITYCTECQGQGWTPRRPCDDVMDDTVRSRGPHQMCTEPSLTPEQQRVWQTVRDLPGVRIRGSNA